MRAKTVAALLIGLGSSAANAAPVYLSCESIEDEKPNYTDIALDEANGTATIADERASGTVQASFQANTVVMTVPTPVPDFSFTFAIDRTSLTVRKFINKGPISAPVSDGQCQLVKPSRKRKF